MVLAILSRFHDWRRSRRMIGYIRNVITKAGLILLHYPEFLIIEETFIYRKYFTDLRSAADWLVYQHCSGEVY